jgi:hypothetical protein
VGADTVVVGHCRRWSGEAGQKGKKKKDRKKTHTFVVLGSVSGVVGTDTVGEVVGAAMGDRCGGRGCGTPGQKGKEKGKKNSLFFFGIRIRCRGRTCGGPMSSVVIISGRVTVVGAVAAVRAGGGGCWH